MKRYYCCDAITIFKKIKKKYVYNLLFIIFEGQNTVESEKHEDAIIYCCYFSKFAWKSHYEYWERNEREMKEKIENVLQEMCYEVQFEME